MVYTSYTRGIANRNSGIGNLQSGFANDKSGLENDKSGFANDESGLENDNSGIENDNSSITNSRLRNGQANSGNNNKNNNKNHKGGKMVKYLQAIFDRLSALKNGMTVNSSTWTGQAETPVTVQTKIDLINTKHGEIESAKDTLSVKYAEARALKNELNTYADGIENIAIGLHSTTKEKLVDYNIELRKPPTPQPPPTLALTIILNDETDGEGFIVSLQKPDPVADTYEFERGVAANPSDVNTIPAMSHFKITKKTSFIDDDIGKGKRYFYRVRAINSRGEGPWSSPVSRVQ